MKGFDYLDRRRPHAGDARNPMRKPATSVKEHSEPGRIGSFFKSVLSGATELLKDDEN